MLLILLQNLVDMMITRTHTSYDFISRINGFRFHHIWLEMDMKLIIICKMITQKFGWC